MSKSCVAITTMAPAARSPRSRAHQRRGRLIVQAGERLVEQHEPRLVQQGALERQALPQPREKPSRGRRRGRSGAPRPARRRRAPPGRIERRTARPKNAQVLARRQIAVEEEIVAEHADARRGARRPGPRPSRPPYRTAPAVGRDQRGQQAEHRGLAGAVRAEQADDLSRAEHSGTPWTAPGAARSDGRRPPAPTTSKSQVAGRRCHQARRRRGAAVNAAHSPSANEGARERERKVARPGWVMRQARDLHRQRPVLRPARVPLPGSAPALIVDVLCSR